MEYVFEYAIVNKNKIKGCMTKISLSACMCVCRICLASPLSSLSHLFSKSLARSES